MAKGLAIGLLALAAVLTLTVLPGDAMPQGGGGGGGWHGGGGGGWHGGGGGWHGGGGGAWHGGHGHGGFHHGGFHHGCCGPRVIVGVGSWWWPYPYYGYYPGYYPYGYPYGYQYPVADTAPPVYIQRETQPEAQYWYYCSGSQAYYPYVKECPGGWIQVAPQPSTQ